MTLHGLAPLSTEPTRHAHPDGESGGFVEEPDWPPVGVEVAPPAPVGPEPAEPVRPPAPVVGAPPDPEVLDPAAPAEPVAPPLPPAPPARETSALASTMRP